MSKNLIETMVGAVVLVVAGLFLYLAYKTTDIGVSDYNSYPISAEFDRADGLILGSDVKLGGIKVGKVIGLTLDPENYKAKIHMLISADVKLPNDSTAEIIGNGLLGEKYVALIPGSEDEFLGKDGVIVYTQSSVSLESLIGKFIFSSAEKASKEETKK